MAASPRPLRGRGLLVTGGAHGIGRGLAKDGARRGARVAILDIDGDAASEVAAGLGGVGLAVDVRDREAVREAVAEAAAELGGIDVAIANAGVADRPASVLGTALVDRRRVLDVNLEGVWSTVEACLPHVIEVRGQIGIVASVYSFMNGVLEAPYAVSKAAVEALARALRVEVADLGVGVTIAHFGFVETALVHEAIDRDPISEELLEVLPRPLRRRISAERAAASLLDALEADRHRVVEPGLWRVVFALRGILGPLFDRRLAGDERVVRALRLVRDRERPTERERL